MFDLGKMNTREIERKKPFIILKSFLTISWTTSAVILWWHWWIIWRWSSRISTALMISTCDIFKNKFQCLSLSRMKKNQKTYLLTIWNYPFCQNNLPCCVVCRRKGLCRIANHRRLHVCIFVVNRRTNARPQQSSYLNLFDFCIERRKEKRT